MNDRKFEAVAATQSLVSFCKKFIENRSVTRHRHYEVDKIAVHLSFVLTMQLEAIINEVDELRRPKRILQE